MVQIFKDEAVIFDLDDLLYKEFDYMRSGFWEIAGIVDKNKPKELFRLMMVQYFLGNAVISWLCNDYLKDSKVFTLTVILNIYRSHKPEISINSEAMILLNKLKANGNQLGLITDGRSVAQRNKINALGLKNWIQEFSISEETGFEKPSLEPYLFFMKKFQAKKFVYIADNYNKDFIAPNQLGWRTIALQDNGLNIHSKKESLDQGYMPGYRIKNLSELTVCF